LVVEETWFVKFISYARATSPAAVKLAGIPEVTVVSETEKMLVEPSLIFRRVDAVPFVPICRTKRSPVAVVFVAGAQDREASAPLVKDVALDEIANPFPVVKLLAVKFRPLPVECP
jgi:hypothetical protein